MGDMNGRVENSKVAGVLRSWGVEGVHENGEHLVVIFMCRKEMSEQKSIIVYLAVKLERIF